MAQHNIIFGDNGSGKTTVLEAAHILGMARSFRAGRAKSLIQHGEQRFVAYGERQMADGGQRGIGVQREMAGEVTLRIGGGSTRSVAQLADELPLLLLNADSFDLLIGEPANRRRFLDWGLFHVEHEQRIHRSRFQRSLSQRNQLLRRDKLDPAELGTWTQDLARHGEAVSQARERFFVALKAVFSPIIDVLAPELKDVELSYRRGWDASVTYLEALERSAQVDREQGFTHSGPQRGDIRVTVSGHSAAETLSRGQQKLLVAALKLAQGKILLERRGGDASASSDLLFLVDDLPSELDGERCQRVCHELAKMQAQTMITCVDRGSIPLGWLGAEDEVAVFHVKHGQVDRCTA